MADIVNIPLNQLTAWNGNVRTSPMEQSVGELAASISSHGLLQSLVVRKAKKGYEIVAGKRRLLAMQLLADQGKLAKDCWVPCQIIGEDADAAEISLAENVMREQMHPADEYEAFRALVDKGTSVADIAARFGVSETVVTKRLKLANLSPVVLESYRNGKISLAQVQAFAISDDHERQEQVLESVLESDWRNDPDDIREFMSEDRINGEDKRVKFVTLSAYEAAGGTVERDLFSDGDKGVFITDIALLDKMVAEKGQAMVEEAKAEGWKWAAFNLDMGKYDFISKHKITQSHGKPEPLSDETKLAIEELEAEEQKIRDAAEAEDDRDFTAEEDKRLEEIEEQVELLQERKEIFSDRTKAKAGVYITVNTWDKIEITRGLIRPEDAKADEKTKKAKSKKQADETAKEEEPEEMVQPLPHKLVSELQSHKTAAMAATLMERPYLARQVIVYSLALAVFQDDKDFLNLGVNEIHYSLPVESCKGLMALSEAREEWSKILPDDAEQLFKWVLDAPDDTLDRLQAFCIALCVTSEDEQRLEKALSFDMRGWYKPTAENFFNRLNKPTILAVMKEALRSDPAPAWSKLKKSELAEKAEQEIAATGGQWLPAPLRPTQAE